MTSETDQAQNAILLKSMGGSDPIDVQGEMTVGRGSSCDVVIEQDRLSRTHAKLIAGDGVLMVEDLGSTNGTFINDNPVKAATAAKNGDVVKFDAFAYQVCITGAVDDSNDTLTDAEALSPGVEEEEILSAKTQVFTPPKSWALDDSPSSEGTQVMSLDMLKQNQATADIGAVDAIETSCPVLVGLSGDTKGKVFKFNTRDKLTKWEVGRADSCEISIDDGSVSTNHAQLIHEGQRWKLIDLMSANGTYVNDNKGLTSYLSSGDKVRFGQVEFLFKLQESDVVASPGSEENNNEEKSASGVPSWAMAAGAFVITVVVLYLFVL